MRQLTVGTLHLFVLSQDNFEFFLYFQRDKRTDQIKIV